MGKLMRQHWMPTCMREEGAERDGAPLKVRLLGEDMVVFRDTEGHLGALDEQCPHRRASLAFGRNEECGLRCLYHGWKFDVNGNAVDLSSEPVDTRLRQTMKTKAYPVREAGGFVWVWMGDPKKVTPFDMPAWAPTDATNIAIVKMHAKCNWAQVLEGSIDSAHSSSLHSSNMPTATDSAWLRDFVVPIPGTTNIDHLDEILDTLSLTISEVVFDQVDAPFRFWRRFGTSLFKGSPIANWYRDLGG